MKKIIWLLAFPIVLAIGGCASIDVSGTCKGSDCDSSIVSLPIQGSSGVVNGVLYSLPRQRVEITINNKLMNLAELKKDLKAFEDQQTTSEAELKSLSQELKLYEDKLKRLGSTNEDLAKDYKKKTNGLTIDIAQKNQALEELKQKIEVKKEEIKKAPTDSAYYQLKLATKALSPHPDPDAVLSAILQDNPRTTDLFEIKTTSSGLLAGGTGTSKGNVDEIFIALASALGATRGSPEGAIALAPQVFSIPDLTLPSDCKDIEFSEKFVVDLQAGNPVEKINHFLSSNDICFHVYLPNYDQFKYSFPLTEVTNKNQTEIVKQTKLPEENEDNSAKGELLFFDGLVYPRQSPLDISICATPTPIVALNGSSDNCIAESGGIRQVASARVSIVDPRRLGVIELSQGVFADNSYEFDFSNGLLTRFKSDRQSEILSFLEMFPAAAKALVAIPAELIQLKFNLSDKERAYYESQTAILKTQLENQYYTENPSAYTDTLNAPADSGT